LQAGRKKRGIPLSARWTPGKAVGKVAPHLPFQPVGTGILSLSAHATNNPGARQMYIEMRNGSRTKVLKGMPAEAFICVYNV